jgi:putative spermidine/putrescine transport system ATP-binding protein
MNANNRENSSSPDQKSQITNHKSFLFLDRLDKRFADLHVTRDLSLSVHKSEIVALLGPSGSGKTTVLRLVAGFEAPDTGRVVVEEEDVTALPPERRRFGMVFQHYALFPHMTAGENVAFGLEAQRMPKTDIPGRVEKTLAAVDLAGFAPRRVTQLSGGQQQRVALARALAPQPRVLLLDEPLSNLDPALRDRTRRELKRLIRRIGITTLFVTHEQEEAFELGDRVAVLNAGHLEQVGTPEELYEEPASRFVASFIGRSSVLPGTWDNGSVRLLKGPSWRSIPSGDRVAQGAEVDLLVRPEGLNLSRSPAADALPGEVVGRRFAGRVAYFDVAAEAGSPIEVLGASDAARVGERVFLLLSPNGPLPRAYPREQK